MTARIELLPNYPSDITTAPAYQTGLSAGFDIAVAEGGSIAPGWCRLFPTGLRIQSPPGYWLMLTARSSLAHKKGLKLANGVGVVDGDFAGPSDQVMLLLHNFTDIRVDISRGERMAQGIFMPLTQPQFIVGPFDAADRGGFGSTGGYQEQDKQHG